MCVTNAFLSFAKKNAILIAALKIGEGRENIRSRWLDVLSNYKMIAYSVEFLLNCKKMRSSLNPGMVNRTQLNPIRGSSSIEFGNRAKSNSEKQILAIEPNRTFGFRTLDFYIKKKRSWRSSC